jgi:hypothetical protein
MLHKLVNPKGSTNDWGVSDLGTGALGGGAAADWNFVVGEGEFHDGGCGAD